MRIKQLCNLIQMNGICDRTHIYICMKRKKERKTTTVEIDYAFDVDKLNEWRQKEKECIV